ncbi:MAG TPA: MoaD/ThiS family protein [Candidatus Baltobacteraceae bacterium]|nr:MoaD/ThiS family protein [Candidatus Baltobacteraceae bacterium]
MTVRTRVRVLAFARIAELLGKRDEELGLGPAARVEDAWSALTERVPALAALRSSTRAARNGRIAAFDEPLADGDEVAFLPPVGGG